jgi:hypothetical protein
MMSVHGKDIMHHICEIVDQLVTREVTEQALCVLVNISNSAEGKTVFMRDEALIKRLIQFMETGDVQLQCAAVTCVTNLAWSREEGATGRQLKLEEIGVKYALQRIRKTQHSSLLERVKVALEQFDET